MYQILLSSDIKKQYSKNERDVQMNDIEREIPYFFVQQQISFFYQQ